MSVKVAINGFGRIGRLAFRQMFGAEGYEVVAINDLTSAKMLAHLLKYDSTQGNYVAQGHTVDFHEGEGEDNYIVVDGKKIVIYKMPNAADLPWGKLGVDVVLECTGFYTSKAKAQAHIDAGARKVVISAPAGNDLPTIVYNVNHKTLTKEDTNYLLTGGLINLVYSSADKPCRQHFGYHAVKKSAVTVSYTHLDVYKRQISKAFTLSSLNSPIYTCVTPCRLPSISVKIYSISSVFTSPLYLIYLYSYLISSNGSLPS